MAAFLLALSGCTTSQDFGDRLRAEGKGTLALGDEWKKGDAMIKRGNKLIERGQRLKRRVEGASDADRIY